VSYRAIFRSTLILAMAAAGIAGTSGGALAGASTALPSGVTGTGELVISPNGDLLVGITSAGALIDSI
jgi:hypothetical protein